MKPQPKDRAQSKFSIHDALYIVFKHKWKIGILSLIGFSVAGFMAYQILRKPSYESVAKLMVRYLVERTTVDPEAGDRMMNGGMLAEMEILMSRDTAIEVAEAVGPASLLPDAKTPPTAIEAAGAIQNGLAVITPPGATRYGPSNLLYLTYRNSDPKITTKVLSALIQTYFRKHLELHRSTETFAHVSKQTDEARSKLRQTEEEINQLKDKSGILTIGATMQEFETRKQAIREHLMAAEAQLAEQRAKVAALKKSQTSGSNVNSTKQAAPPGGGADNPQASAEEAEAKRKHTLALAEYGNLSQRAMLFQQRRNELLVLRKPGDSMLSALDRQISDVHKRLLDLTETYPELLGRMATTQSGPSTAPVLSLDDEKAIESAFEAKLEAIKGQVKGLETEVARISALGFQLQDLERRRQLEEDKYRYFQSSLEKARLDETLDPNKIPNISVVQSPSPPEKSIDVAAMKLIFGIASSGLVLGLALAFLIEMVIDRRVSSPVEIRTRLQLPLMMSIPYIRSKDAIAKLIGTGMDRGLPGYSEDIRLAPESKNNGSAKPDRSGEHFIAPYVAAMHDRIIFNFQINNINHKPKLVALTGLSQGAGTSTIAAGLAKAFADNGDRKVLLVNLDPEALAVQEHHSNSLFKALEDSQSERFRGASRNLYFASASTRRDCRNAHALAPADLHRLMPQLVASDFDYIIFDMPPIGPTSPTLTMAGFMDKVLLVLDGNRTTREHLSWAYSELEKAKADVSCVFNKARSHAPQWVQGDV
jgi:uncharacterized protein involved in exopolysaccharide biosynthesis/Mrp family chromosome partitioning ATPase